MVTTLTLSLNSVGAYVLSLAVGGKSQGGNFHCRISEGVKEYQGDEMGSLHLLI